MQKQKQYQVLVNCYGVDSIKSGIFISLSKHLSSSSISFDVDRLISEIQTPVTLLKLHFIKTVSVYNGILLR